MSEIVPNDPAVRDRHELPDRPRLAPFRVEGPRVRALILSPSVTTTWVHWTGFRTSPCELGAPGSHCPHCDRGTPLVRQHWLLVANPAASVFRAQPLHLTDPAAEHDPLFWAHDGTLDGRFLWLWRMPAHPRGRMFAELDQGEQAATVPSVEQTIRVLRRMWGGRLRFLDRHSATDQDPPAETDPPS